MEEIVGSLDGVSYRTYDTVCDLLFTAERVIAFIVRHPTDFQPPPMWEQVFVGNILSKRRGQLERASVTQALDNLQEKSIDELLAMHQSNFEIRYSEVTSVKITRGLFQSQLVFDTSRPSTARQTIRFNISKRRIPDAQRLLELVLASKIKEK
ncbi:hypothetical protein ACFLWY_01145 [Chloroflexota bacterium]